MGRVCDLGRDPRCRYPGSPAGCHVSPGPGGAGKTGPRHSLGSAEAEIAGKFVEAAKIYADHPAALQLRAMNIIYETTKERGTTILIPTSMVDSMNPASALVLAAQRAPSEGFPSLKSAA
jgi:hypothetical protein